MARLTFEERNKNNYTKYSDVPIKQSINNKRSTSWRTVNHLAKYGLWYLWRWFYTVYWSWWVWFVFDYIDKLLEPSIVFGVTALGDLLIWEGNNNWTISPDEGNRVLLINIRKCTSEILGDMDFLLNFTLGDETAIIDKEYFDSRPYLNIKGKLPTLQYGQC